MKRANGIITDEGGVTCHAAIVSRELGIPCVVGTGDATKILKENSVLTLDGNKGLIYEGKIVDESPQKEESAETTTVVQQSVLTVTEVKVNVSMPEAAKKAAATGADGVGLLRTEHMMLTTGVHPKKFIKEGNEDQLIKVLVENILRVADAFYPKTVWYRTLDAPTDEFERLADFPQSGRVVPEFGVESIREIVHPPVRIVYRLEPGRARVVRIWRSERLLPSP